MGRKTNSIGLRLKKTNKDYMHCWYGDILYGYNLENSLKIYQVFSDIFQKIDISCPQFSLTGGYKKARFLLCYLDPSTKNNSKELFNIETWSKSLNKKENNPFSSRLLDQFSNKWSFVKLEAPFQQIQRGEPQKAPGYIYKGSLGLIPNNRHKPLTIKEQCLGEKLKAQPTTTGHYFNCNFLPFYSGKNLFLEKYSALIKKDPQWTPLKGKQHFLNFQKSLVFLEAFALGKTTGLFFGKKKTLHCKPIEVVAHDSSSSPHILSQSQKDRVIPFALQGHLEGKRTQQQFPEKRFGDHALVLTQSIFQNIYDRPKTLVKTWDLEKQNYIWNLYNNIKGLWGNLISISFVKSPSEKACALFLAHYVSYFLERKILFRRIKKQLLLSLLSQGKIKFGGKKKTQIKGLRISCSGRVGGRSKKAQRSRKETFMWGETGLHVFSNKLDFAQTYAQTSFGTVGIKVWVCYK